ncbi:MAG: aromatic ring-hydroxylating dioxygenase subunit alpha [Gammaproteobacteria bacterium]|jgi:phenylpropionate dioxygenase-like ring-hydroxylating dioxygenase large terminal subunit|nr:aromatic ring-hydroxylating dioxygenase subunit alpha [Gammaproteobacteria bacterium]
MYINFWYPIVRSEDLGYDQPEKVRVLGVDLVAFRDKNGDAHVLSDTCTHRGASLGGAWSQGNRPRIIDGCIVCPYHGWEFNSDGECVNLPSIGYGAKTPARAKVDSYPVQEKYGIVFAFLGDEPEESRIPLLDVEEYGQEGWVANEVLVLEVPYYYERSIENGIDPSHNEFVHPTHGHSSIDRESYRVREYEAEDHRQGWGFWFWHLFDTPPLPQKDDATAGGQETPWGDTRTEDHVQMKVGGGTYGPNSMPTYINITADKMFRQYFFELPVDENNTKIFFLNMRNFMLDPKHNGPIHARNKVIAAQDIQILTTMCPERTPLSSTDEVLTPSDNGVAAYRKWLEKFDDKGLRIDINKFNARHGKDKAYAIPSPARRTSGNWVLDEIPRIKDRAERNRLNKDD